MDMKIMEKFHIDDVRDSGFLLRAPEPVERYDQKFLEAGPHKGLT